jgi:Uma2 family endonuclease
MATVAGGSQVVARMPTHLDLPDTDGKPVENSLQAPQTALLTGSFEPVARALHPDGRYFIGEDVGIYYRHTDPPLDGCRAPDWFYVPGVPGTLDGDFRRSYVLWQELVRPAVVMEFVSGDGREERDRSPLTGKFWIYERAIGAPVYVIFEPFTGQLEVHGITAGGYRPVAANDRGHYPLPGLGLELGVWTGPFRNYTAPWVRFWDARGVLLPSAEERAEEAARRAEEAIRRAEEERQAREESEATAEQERQRAETAEATVEQERQRAEAAEATVEQERQRAGRLAERLRQLGGDPDQL